MIDEVENLTKAALLGGRKGDVKFSRFGRVDGIHFPPSALSVERDRTAANMPEHDEDQKLDRLRNQEGRLGDPVGVRS